MAKSDSTMEMLGRVQHQANTAHYELAGYWSGDIGPGIDEMSLLFHDDAQMELHLFNSTLYGGWKEFNRVVEILVCTTHGSPHFGKSTPVQFSFWEHPDVRYRIEAMTYISGFGGLPLHDHALLASDGEPVVIHASFKPANYEQFINRQPGHPTLCYENGYGKFSYWGKQATYLKPRVNLRDGLA